MVYTTKKQNYFWTWACCLCLGLCSLNAQSTVLSIAAVTTSINDSLQNIALKSLDGPYLFTDDTGSKLMNVIQTSGGYQIQEEYIDRKHNPTLSCTVNNKDEDSFSFPLLSKIKSPNSIYKQPEKLLAISDIEGNFNAFYGLLVNNGVMDSQYNWTYGNGHLVLIGDFMDRGNSVTQVLWLIYKLEQEAKKHNGVVHFILGNHEVLNLNGKTNYVDKKYIKLAQKYAGKTDGDEAYAYLMSDRQELVKWLKSKNAVEKIGNTLFVHGGISPELVQSGLTISKINSIVRRRLNNGPAKMELDKMDEDFLLASHGPLWYRGMATRYRNYYKRMTIKQIERSLRYFRVDHIAIGHTIAKNVSLDFSGKIIRTDVKHGIEKNSPASQALFIKDDQLFRVDGTGKQFPLKPIPNQ